MTETRNVDPDRVLALMMAGFGTTVYFWPVPRSTPPKWWQRNDRKQEKPIIAVVSALGLGPVDQDFRDRFWEQRRYGQGVYEDAGSYLWRCWCAALRLPFEPVAVVYKDIEHVING